MTDTASLRDCSRIFPTRSTAVSVFIVAAAMLPPANAQSTRGGEDVVKSVCSKCHQAGANGAPKIGDRSAWVPRISQGLDRAVASAIHGHGAMPARGGTADLTDGEMRSAIVYMVNPVYAQAARAVVAGAASPPVKTAANYRWVGGLDVYVGFVSADRLHRYSKEAPERTMHGGVPSGSGYEHVNVTIFDHATMIPVPSARVTATVEEVGLTSESKTLQPMTAAGSYGNYFRMTSKNAYRVTVHIATPESTRAIEAKFERGPS